MYRNRSVDVHQFAMVPKAEIPRSSFRMQKNYKTAFDAGYLVPVFCEEVLPGDTFNVSMTAFCRLATPIFPFMDNVYLESFFFYVPNRLVWPNWVKFMGQQNSPGDSISYTVPICSGVAGGYPIGSLFDYFGLPTVGQVSVGQTVTHSSLPLRGYNLIYNEWFRDENLIAGAAGGMSPTTWGDGPDAAASFSLRRRGKRHDYFTGALPWTQKGGLDVTIPLGTSAVVRTLAAGQDNPGMTTGNPAGTTAGLRMRFASGGSFTADRTIGWATANAPNIAGGSTAATHSGGSVFPSNLYADLSTATAATINQLRQSFQIQKLLERDARGGTRYTEVIRAHFGVISPDARLQRPEYLGGGSSPIAINPVAQTSNTPVSGTPQGNLSAFGTALARHGFSQSFTEHGYIIGLVNVRADLTYQQGLRRHWSRQTRYDFYFPAFAMLGEQAILNKEIYCDGTANDALVFGYQERWAEYRYNPSEITGLMRSTAAGTIDPWHLSQKFTALPTLNQTFIEDSPPLARVLAVGASANGQQLIADLFFDAKVARPLPLYSVPGLIDHF